MPEEAAAGKRDAPEEAETKEVPAKSPPAKRRKEKDAGTPPVSGGGTETPASGAGTKSKKKPKNPIFDKFFDKSGQAKAVGAASAKENKGRATNGAEGGLSREACFKKAQNYRQNHPVPCTVGDITVTALGNVMVEKGPKAPLFHTTDCIYPMNYKSMWKDPKTGTQYHCEVLDGMDVVKKDVLAGSVSFGSEKVVKESLEEAWQEVRAIQIERGSPEDKASAKEWPTSNLEERFGLKTVDIRKRIEGMRGTIDCFMYRFVNERVGGGSEAGASKSPAKAKAKVQGKLTFEGGEGKKKGEKKGKGGSAEAGSADKGGSGKGKAAKGKEDAAPAPSTDEKKPASKIKRTGKSALQIFSKDVRQKVKDENPEVADKINEINRIINRMFKDLPDDERAAYEAKSTRQVIRLDADGDEDGQQEGGQEGEEGEEGEEKQEEPEEDTSMWHKEGSEYLGKRGRRYVYDARGKIADAVHGTIEMWLPKEEADYTNEETGEPGALWRLVYDDRKTGADDLDEQEVQEAIALMQEELPEKVKEKVRKREERAAEAKIKKEAAEQLKLLKQQAKQGEKDRKKLEKKLLSEDVAKAKEEFRADLIPGPDESMMTVKSGPNKGRLAIAIKKPEGSTAAFPPPSAVQDFLPVFMFLRDLSGPLGAARMSFDEVKACISGETLEAQGIFYEVAKWLTNIAVRTRWMREEEPSEQDKQDKQDKEEAETENDRLDVVDLTLAPGPNLNAKSKDNITYSCWQLINESSWPELVRMLMRHGCVQDVYQKLHDALGEKEPSKLSLEERLSLLRFLCDEACNSDKVQIAINAKLRQVDRILEKKRAEDAAIRRRDAFKKQQEKKQAEGAAGADASMPDAGADVPAAADADKDDAVVSSGPKATLTAVQIMQQLHAKDPQPFTVKYKDQEFEGVLDNMSGEVNITCAGQTFQSPVMWVKWCQQKSKAVSIKSIVRYKGKSLKQCEEEYQLRPPSDTGAATKGLDIEALAMELSLEGLDHEKRAREIQAALHKASKGLRHDPIGHDRWWRCYYCFDGVTDIVWACDAPDVSAVAGPVAAPEGTDYGYDGRISEAYRTMYTSIQGQTQRWTCYTHEDGTLRALCDMLLQGPLGPREQALVDALRANGITKGFEAEADGGASASPSKKDAEGAGSEADGGAESAERGDDGYDWVELPKIGDVVWAREKDKNIWIPVKLVEPPGDGPVPLDKGAGDEDEVDEDFQNHGSVYIGKRVSITIQDKRKERVADGTVKWFLPLERSDFVSESTGKTAALYRVKFDDPTLTDQDLEDFEVREAMIVFAKAEAQRRGKNSDVLSSRSMFGQEIRWVYGQLFTDREPVDKYELRDVQPFLEFREIRQQEMRRANKNSILRQVAEANYYLDQRTSLQDQEQELKVILKELRWSGTTEQQMSEEQKASCIHCMRYPRVLNVVQDSREALPSVTSWQELQLQLKALYKKLGANFVPEGHDVLKGRLELWVNELESKETLEGVVESMRVLEQTLNEDADRSSIEHEESMPVDLDDWRTEGPNIGKRLAREIKGRFGHLEGYCNARVVGWLPVDESDYKDEKGVEKALWHIVRDDGEEEDLEDFEVEAGMHLLIKRGDHPDHSRHSGIWPTPRDRERWSKLAGTARTTGAAALALYLLGDMALQYMSALTLRSRLAAEEWDEFCFICAEGGNLLCCDACPRTVHAQCVGLPKAPKGDFYCYYCELEKEKSGKKSGKAKSGKDAKQEEEPSSSKARGADRRDGGAGSKRDREKGEASGRPDKAARKTADAKKGWSRPETREDLESLRKLLVRNGAHNGSVAEVQADQAAVKKGERWFVQVVDGDVINKKDSPQLKAVYFFTDWKPKKGDRIKVDTKSGMRPVDIASIMCIGKITDLLEGSERKGYIPVDPRL